MSSDKEEALENDKIFDRERQHVSVSFPVFHLFHTI